METIVEEILTRAVGELKRRGELPGDFFPDVIIERPKREEFGDYGCPLPLAMAKAAHKSPKDCGNAILEVVDAPSDLFDAITFAPPGFLNFKVNPRAWFMKLQDIAADPEGFGGSGAGRNQRVLIEFVSANPTGPLHVGHARGAVLGDALARIMSAAGYDVDTEYYINDVGNQMATLGRSLYARGRETLGLGHGDFPENGYLGDYIRELAAEFAHGEGRESLEKDYEDLGPVDDNPAVGFASSRLLELIKDDLNALGVGFNQWFSERSLHDRGLVPLAVQSLLDSGRAYKDASGAVLFRMDDDDEDDRVIVRGNGISTYFASDIAYHHEKAGRGYARLINIWGSDHHGYIPRVKAAMAAMGHDPDMLEVLLVQMVTLTRGGEVVPMGKRSGRFVTLREVVDEVGPDAVRFIFLLRKADSQMEFDLDLAKSQSMENPVYYVQYGHARVASILRKADAAGLMPAPWSKDLGDVLSLPEERNMAKQLTRLPGVVASSAIKREPHHLAFYLMDLVKGFHSYYTRYAHTDKVISDDAEKTAARLFLVSCVKAVLARGLGMLGVGAPDEMHYGGDDEQG
ncbi:MAG: arginine--tRNA ligase [Deltaproteobacteria bacterium]|nr:arginine--tRNA ligase [Deltaproteobacteria bacterium]